MNARILSLIALTFVLLLNACSPLTVINAADEQPAPSADPQAENPAQLACSELVELPIVDGKILYNGLSFELDPAIAGSVSARMCPGKPGQAQQMGDEAHPPYAEFVFPDFERQNADFQPEIRVYEVTGDLQSYLFPLNVLDDLRQTLEQQPEPVTWFQHSPLHTHQAYLEFAEGAGVRGLLQYMQDYFFFTNNGLIYEFQGLTQDGRYFVSVRYPVSVPFLMEMDGISLPPTNLNPQAIAIPAWPGDYEGQRQIIEAYNTEALRLFEQMSDTEALPNLALLDRLVQSIRIGQP